MLRKQSGFVLVVVPILLVGLVSLGVMMTSQSRTAMRLAGAGLDHVQARLCTQQCASLAVNAAVVNQEGGAGIRASSHPCSCGDQDADRMDCTYTYSSPQSGSRTGCYDLRTHEDRVTVVVRCRDARGGSVTLEEVVALNEVPIFQFSLFSDKVLPLHPGPDMDVPGKVHSNDSIQFYPENDLRISDWVTSPVGIYAYRRKNAEMFFARKQGGGFSGPVVPGPAMGPLESMIPGWSGWLAGHRVAYGRHTNGCGGAQPLRLPLRSIGDPHDLIDWRRNDDNQALRRQRFAHKASLLRYQGNWVDQDLSPLFPASNPVRNPPGAVPGHPGRIRLWDRRDEIMLHLVPIDAAALQSGFGRSDSIIYLHDEYRDHAQGGRIVGGYLLWNARRLTRALTIATNSRLVLHGDFNVVPDFQVDGSPSPFPAALISDVMMHLSSDFVWTEHDQAFEPPPVPVLQRNPGARMTVNACIMSGMVAGSDGGMGQSGGLHNLMRFQEQFEHAGRRAQHTTNGSLVCMWASRHSNTEYNSTPEIYTAPQRTYAFAPMYQSLRHLPPGTPRLVGPNLNSWEIVR